MNTLDKIKALNLPAFRIKQIAYAIFKESKLDFDNISVLSKDLRAKLTEEIPLRTLKPLKVQVSQNKDTIKWSFLTSKGKPIETVLMLHSNGRRTVCVSCQSGCPVNCSFCWTGAMGFQQNLDAWEIVEQILIINEWLKNNQNEIIECGQEAGKDLRVNRVVFMGMGEPMINLNEVKAAINILMDPDYFNLGQRSITVSTSGYVPMMKMFWTEYPKIGVAISLHAPTQELRAQIMPVAKQYSLDKLMEMCRHIQSISKRRITYEYILIDNLTDTRECAIELSKLLKGQLAHVNLIPYNPIAGREYKRPSRNRVMNFVAMLKELGVSATPRVTMGDDIKAACGQLSEHVKLEN